MNGMRFDRAAARISAFVFVASILAFSFAPRHQISDLTFMDGCWEMRTADRVVEEHWMGASAGIMLGSGRTVHAGKLVEYEATRIEQHGDSLLFFASPSGQEPSSFVAIKSSSKEVVFHDLQHDFPQRVIYRSRGDSLLASVEGRLRGEEKVISFPYGRVSCTGNRGTPGGVSH